ncbi:MAG: hypothetical protein H5T61_11125 [Thermoflexales bacterium]|nr:hypothetical protein [Thermoflexales bacterium]
MPGSFPALLAEHLPTLAADFLADLLVAREGSSGWQRSPQPAQRPPVNGEQQRPVAVQSDEDAVSRFQPQRPAYCV